MKKHSMSIATITLLVALAISDQLAAQTFTVLHSFTGLGDGALPYGTLIEDAAGNVYGAASAGGNTAACSQLIPPGCGVVFRFDPEGDETVLYTFNGPPDGANPAAGLVMDKFGNLYGTTSAGGPSTACYAVAVCSSSWITMATKLCCTVS